MIKIDGGKIARMILDQAKSDVAEIVATKKIAPPQLVIFSVSPDEVTLSFLRSKQKAVEHVGGTFKLLRFSKNIRFEDLAKKLNEINQDPQSNAIVIQHPLPASLSTMTIFDFVSPEKEIEAYKAKPLFESPVALSVLTILKGMFVPNALTDYKILWMDVDKDAAVLKNIMRKKKLVLVGRGKTAGKPIAEVLSRLHIPFVNINSNTVSPEQFLQEADVVISAVGKPVIHSAHIKEGAALISVGLRSEENKWVGDYQQNEIKDKSLAFTPTPGGVGPVTVAYIVSNLVKAWKMQNGLA
jgi:methylenetetrahydrofolate dehydrogenase (NADP+)/methenyltetrahydrofolate cyclohydrolase